MKWRNTAEALGIIAIVGSLIFVGLQLKQSEEIAIREGLNNTLTSLIESRSDYYDNADVWVRGNAGEELTRTELFIYRDLVRLESNRTFYQSLWRRVFDPSIESTAEKDFAVFLFQNPGARKVWIDWQSERNKFVDRLRTGADLARTQQSGSVAFRERILTFLTNLEELEE